MEIPTVPIHFTWRNYKIRQSPRERKYGYQARIKSKKHTLHKSFSFKNFNYDKKEAFLVAYEWTRKTEEDLKVAKNMIRYLDESIIEIQCKGDSTKRFITDAKYLNLVLKKTWRLRPDGYTYYVSSSDSSGALHQEIMGNKYEQTDHINGLGNDDRMINLRDGTRGVNANNKGKNKSNTTGINGISWSELRQDFMFKWSEDEIRYYEYFSTFNYETKEKAFEVAKEFREVILADLREKGIENNNGREPANYKQIVKEIKNKRKMRLQ